MHSMARRLGRRALAERAQPPLPHLGEVHVVAMHLRSGAREGLEAVLTRRCADTVLRMRAAVARKVLWQALASKGPTTARHLIGGPKRPPQRRLQRDRLPLLMNSLSRVINELSRCFHLSRFSSTDI